MQRAWQVMRRLLVGLLIVYSAGLVVLALFWASGGRWPWWAEIANVLALVLFAPLLILFPLALLRPSRPLRVITSLLLIVFATMFGGAFVPPAAPQPSGIPLRVLTFNLHFRSYDTDGSERIQAMLAQQADVIALQELSIPVAESIRQRLSTIYPYQLLAPLKTKDGMGLISRYPLQAVTQDNLPGQWVRIDLNGTEVDLINASLTAPRIKRARLPHTDVVVGVSTYRTSRRASEIARLVPVIDSIHGPLVVLGDFNISDREPDYHTFAMRLSDAYRATNWGLGSTFPINKSLGPIPIPTPLIRIDYIWSANGASPAAASVSCNHRASDHCLVVADVRVNS